MRTYDEFWSLESYVREYMRPSIQAFGLVAGAAPDGLMTLSNAHCIIYLDRVGSEYVGFTFASQGSPETRFGLGLYLDAVVDGGAAVHCPFPEKELEVEAKFVHYLTSFDGLIVAGALDAPLLGDFGWAGNYRRFVDKYQRLATELSYLSAMEHPEAVALLRKRLAFDLSWMEDVRRILLGKMWK
jgi:hypothetical protein